METLIGKKAKQKLTSVDELPIGGVISETQYYTVVSKTSTGVTVVNERGFGFTISNGIVEEGCFSAGQFKEEVKVTKTQLAEIFSNIGDTVFTVSFNKLPVSSDVNDAIKSLNSGGIKSNADMKKIVKGAFEGEERILVGYRTGGESILGRSTVIDLRQERGDNPDWDARTRQVDHRQINWFIYKNVKYSLK